MQMRLEGASVKTHCVLHADRLCSADSRLTSICPVVLLHRCCCCCIRQQLWGWSAFATATVHCKGLLPAHTAHVTCCQSTRRVRALGNVAYITEGCMHELSTLAGLATSVSDCHVVVCRTACTYDVGAALQGGTLW